MSDHSTKSHMNLPNRLTMLRIFLVPVFILFAALANHQGSWYDYFLAGLVFALASFTDLLDGKIARKRDLVTDFGKFADPLADKILTTAALIYMMEGGVCHPLVLCLVLAREFAVAGIRMVAAGAPGGKVIAANLWGKAKTVLQMGTVLVFYFGSAIAPLTAFTAVFTRILCWAVAVLTLISGGIYIWDNRSFIEDC